MFPQAHCDIMTQWSWGDSGDQQCRFSVISEASRVPEHVWAGKRLRFSPIPLKWFWRKKEPSFYFILIAQTDQQNEGNLACAAVSGRPNSPTVPFNQCWVIRVYTSKIPAGLRLPWLRRWVNRGLKKLPTKTWTLINSLPLAQSLQSRNLFVLAFLLTINTVKMTDTFTVAAEYQAEK